MNGKTKECLGLGLKISNGTIHESARTCRAFLISRDAGTGGQEGQLPPLPFAERDKGGKVPFKYKEYYITVSF